MKQSYLWLLPLFFLGIIACGGDDSDESVIGEGPNVDVGKDNTTDLVVTGGVDYGYTTALVLGYINIDPLQMPLVQRYGVKFGENKESLESTANSVDISDRQFVTILNGLEPGKTYYYRYFVYTGIFTYGEILSFTTEKVPNEIEAIEIHPDFSSCKSIGREVHHNTLVSILNFFTVL